jgi:hypothetical protein
MADLLEGQDEDNWERLDLRLAQAEAVLSVMTSSEADNRAMQCAAWAAEELVQQARAALDDLRTVHRPKAELPPHLQPIQ